MALLVRLRMCMRHRCSLYGGNKCASRLGYTAPQGAEWDLCACGCCRHQCNRPKTCRTKPLPLAGVEAGLSWDRDRSTFAATVFRNRIEEAIVNVTLGEGPGLIPALPRAGFVPAGGVLRQRQNAGVIEATGLELTAEHRLAFVTLVGAVSATDARVKGGSTAPQLTGLRPAQAPVLNVTGGLDWRVTPVLTFAVRGRYESRRFDDDLNSRILDAAATADVRAEWQVREAVLLYAGADNVADARVEVSETADGVSGFGPPRTYRLGLRFQW
jgi:outer membrane receptor protein involved in Fe transport